MPVADRLDHPRRHLRLGLIEMAVDAGHHVIEACQHAVVIIQAAIGQDVAFDALEQANALELFIELVDLRLLLPDPFWTEPVSDGQGGRVVRDAQILVAELLGGRRHLF